MPHTKDWTFLRRVAADPSLPGAVCDRLRSLAKQMEDKDKRDNGKEPCEACGKWKPLESMVSSVDDCYFCADCAKGAPKATPEELAAYGYA